MIERIETLFNENPSILTTDQEYKQAIIERICLVAEQITLKNPNIIFSKNKLPYIVQDYRFLRDSLRSFLLKDSETDFDRHRVATVATLAILKNSPIVVADPKKINSKTLNANILLTFLISNSIIEDFYLQESGEEIKIVTSNIYAREYIKLIENNMVNLQSIWVNPKQDLSNILFFISHIFYLLEEISKK
ncbi:hypothetical protein [Aliarcobacter cryaerophilus]|uniref:hypothetical protein n=1 Tax=Aliarcobacter cryaerophilus TaxID=28198 RepID=UPI00082CCBB2|nr:hypothetical protein [Aliarcobacter cryaerophilus]